MSSVTVPVSALDSVPTNVRGYIPSDLRADELKSIDYGGTGVTPESSTRSGRLIYGPDGVTVTGIVNAAGKRIPVPPFKPKPVPVPTSPIGNNLGAQGDGTYAGVTGPATYYDVHREETAAASAGESLASVQEGIRAGGEGLSTASGQLTPGAQAQLVAGLSLYEVQKIQSFLDPTALITFDLVNFRGATLYVNARLQTAAEAEQKDNGGFGMNHPTAHQYLEEGIPIARQSWAAEFDELPTRWLTKCGEAVADNRPDGRNFWRQGEDPTLTLADLFAQDYITAPGVTLYLPEQPDYPGSGADLETPPFDVFSPPTRVC